MSEPFYHLEGGWTFRLQPSQEPLPGGVLVAIHGWTGNETSMGIFTRNLHAQYWIIFPRAPFVSPSGGYSWVREARGVAQDYSTFQAIGIVCIERIKKIQSAFHIDNIPVSLLGFSQGAALALTLSLEPSFRVSKVGLLSGFLPANMPAGPFSAMPEYLITHGNQDTIVPISHAYETRDYLDKNNARVDFCETDAGHKLSTACFKTLEGFFLRYS